MYVTDWCTPPLPLSFIADLAAGLSDDSRIRRKINKSKLTLSQALQAITADKLALLVWQKTKDGSKGRNAPESIYKKIMGLNEKEKDELMAFKTPEDFDKWFKSKQR